MLVDSGADVTILPASLVSELVLDSAAETQFGLEGFEGSRSLAKAVQLEVLFLKKTFRGQFILLDQECGVMGRNLLNSIRLVLDGPNLRWNEYRP